MSYEPKVIYVHELIEFLKTQPQDLPVAYRLCSDYTELELDDIRVIELQLPRGDGYIGSKREDKPSIKWLVFPGN